MKDFSIEARKVGLIMLAIKKILRNRMFVWLKKILMNLFKEITGRSSHIAILVDEYGGFSGIVTVEDFQLKKLWEKLKMSMILMMNLNYRKSMIITIIDGNYLIDDPDDELDLKLNNINCDTISVVSVIHLLGEIPSDNPERTVTYKNLTFKITGVKGNRITKIKLLIDKSTGS